MRKSGVIYVRRRAEIASAASHIRQPTENRLLTPYTTICRRKREENAGAGPRAGRYLISTLARSLAAAVGSDGSAGRRTEADGPPRWELPTTGLPHECSRDARTLKKTTREKRTMIYLAFSTVAQFRFSKQRLCHAIIFILNLPYRHHGTVAS